MKSLQQLIPTGIVLGVASLTLALIWVGRSGLPAAGTRSLEAAPAVLEEEERLSAWLEDRRQATFQKLQRKDDVVTELIAGDISLCRAVEQFLAIEAQRPDLWALTQRSLAANYPERPLEECVARNIVERTLLRVSGDPRQLAALQTQLEGQLHEYLQR